MIQPGERRCFAITIVDDLIAEQTEDIEVHLRTAVAPDVFLEYVYFDIADNDGRYYTMQQHVTRASSVYGYCTQVLSSRGRSPKEDM